VVVVEINGYTIEPGANLYEANLAGANLAGANLDRAYLTEADLRKVNLAGARANELVARAKANELTIWPEGFDPVAAGVIFED